jgi:hypothetical protein
MFLWSSGITAQINHTYNYTSKASIISVHHIHPLQAWFFTRAYPI